ncbi:methylated-DNA--[protein]-cysteine S-methyltransferase [Gayadomonas joobiniege]|uniref:methylated-DNA--[protein]-cysteine S-methyltransferase n=1 Tax=Gayadomonas joobiniege TaxID=1234606 RepID=UPI00037CE314|nr:methylated-DNA--[protein]-cysteine S-methyltransferase [Gayadomonas joobiniege]
MRPIAQAVINTQVGKIAIINNANTLLKIDLYAQSTPYQIDGSNALTEAVCEQLLDYFEHRLLTFKIPIAEQGTAFQQRVWKVMSQIPYGESLTYGQLAKQIGSSARAVGGACRRNPLPIIRPCHRVVAATGIGGYSGQWWDGHKVDIKKWLLTHETY